jgi:hypothetical protein
MKRKPEVERLEVLREHYELAQRRMRPFIRVAAGHSACGTFDIGNLAVSAYLQGVWDGIQSAERTPREAAEYLRQWEGNT